MKEWKDLKRGKLISEAMRERWQNPEYRKKRQLPRRCSICGKVGHYATKHKREP